MRKWYTYIIMLATILFGSCNLEDTLFPEQECETDDITVRIVLSMMDSRANTRAYDPPHTDDYETTALGNEYYINQYDVEVLVFDDSGNFVERATLVQATGPTPNFHTYELTGTLSNIVEENTYQMVVLANRSGSAYCTNFSNTIAVGTSMTDVLEPLIYGNYTAAFTEDLLTEGSTERIPMWGVVKAELKDEATITVNMLRAMAKVRVNLDAEGDAEGYTLAGVTLNQANNGGYFTPTMTKGIKTNGSTESVSEARIPSGLTVLKNLFFVEEPGNTGSYVIYVPECNTFKETGETRAATTWMTVSINDALGNTVNLGENNKLYFREYRNSTGTEKGEYFDIVRNYFYDYTITGVDDNSSSLALTLSVVDWTYVSESFNYESELSYKNGGWTNNSDRKDNTIVLKTSSEADANTVTAVYRFQINTPQTIEWMAVLEDPSMKFEFDMDNTSGKGTAEGENAIQRTVKGELLVTGSDLKLGVKAIDPSESGQYEAKLRVYVTYSGKTIELDLVDGKEALNHFTIQHSKL